MNDRLQGWLHRSGCGGTIRDVAKTLSVSIDGSGLGSGGLWGAEEAVAWIRVTLGKRGVSLAPGDKVLSGADNRCVSERSRTGYMFDQLNNFVWLYGLCTKKAALHIGVSLF